MVRAVFAVEVLGASPGNCTAVSGLVDAVPAPRFEPVVSVPADPTDPEPVVADPVATAPEAAPIADPLKTDAVDVSDALGAFDGFERQPGAAAVPLDVVPDVGHGVAATLVPAGFVPAEPAAPMLGCAFTPG